MSQKIKKIPVVFAINNEYVKMLATVIASILKNSKAEYEFNILSTDISEKNKEILSLLGKNINFVDMNQVVADFDLEKYMSRRKDYMYISIETYFRFFIPELFPQHEKVIYLDADTLVLGDLANLFDEDISNFYAGVVEDLWIEEHLRRKAKIFDEVTFSEYFEQTLEKTNLQYFNAGILLLNLEKLRKDNIVEKLWNFSNEHGPLHFQDQDVLNAVLENHVKYVDLKWNVCKDIAYLKSVFKKTSLKKTIAKTMKNVGIVHYIGANKPWLYAEFHDYDYKFIKEWWDYYKRTPYFVESDLDIYKAIAHKQKSRYHEYFVLKISKFTILSIIKNEEKIRFVILNLLKTHLRSKKPAYCVERSV